MSAGTVEWPFINLAKTAGGWFGLDTTNNGVFISPSWLASDGYPNQVGTNGVYLLVYLPLGSSFTDNLTLIWDVTGAAPSDTATLAIGNFGSTPVSGSLTSTGPGTNFSYTFTPTGQINNPTTQQAIRLTISALTGAAHVTNIRLCWASHYTAMMAGELLNPQFKSKQQSLRQGIWRFMDWAAVGGQTTTWSSRKTMAYPTWASSEFRASLYPGDIMTNVGNDYFITFGSGAPSDKQTMHVLFNANATLIQNEEAGGTLTLTLPGGGAAVTFNWTAHGLSNGNLVSINVTAGSPIQNFWQSVNYYVVNATANSFQVSLSSGGSAVGSTATSTSGNMRVTRLQTLDLNTTGAAAIRSLTLSPFTGLVPTRANGSVLLYGTLVYDAPSKSWLLAGAGTAGNYDSSGIQTLYPPEACVQLCAELGMHPHLSIPMMALDTISDFVPSLASYIKTSAPSWMIPRFEPVNEIWNYNAGETVFADSKAFLYWGTQYDHDNWYGMVLSLMGQAVASVYGAGNLGTSYEIMCGVQTTMGSTPVPSPTTNARLTATNFVSSGPTPPAGYVQAAAKTYTSGILCATYVNPGMQSQNAELENTWNYYVTNVGNSTAQMANLNAYADSFNRGVSGTTLFTVGTPGVVNWPAHGLSVGDILCISTTGSLLTGVTANANVYVSNVVDADHFNITYSVGGASGNFSGTQSGTHYISYGSLGTYFFNGVYQNLKSFGAANGVNKLFAYEGGYSPDLTGGTWNSPITGASNASSCVLTLATTNSPDRGANLGNPAIVGMMLSPQNAGGMTQLNCATGIGVTITSGTASIPYASNSLVANQGIMFTSALYNILPSNISLNTVYYVSATGLSSSAFQISASPGGAVITPTGSNGPFTMQMDTGWVVSAVSGNNVTILCNSTSFGTYTSGGSAIYSAGVTFTNDFRLEVLKSATDLATNLLANYNNYMAAGGLFPSQYGFALDGVWGVLSDMYQPLNQQGQMIAAYNA